MGDLNKVMLIGRAGKDCEVSYTQGGQALARVSIATESKWTDKGSGEKQSKTEWHNVTIWGKLAESVGQYIVKGKTIYVEGRLETKEVEKDGSKRFYTNVIAENIQLLGSKGDEQPESESRSSTPQRGRNQKPKPNDPPDDDIPF